MVAQQLEDATMLANYPSAKQRLLLFDYDGTLTPIVEDPATAILSPEALRSIQQLAARPRNEVWIISGRNQAFLEQTFGHSNEIGLIAEHGSFLRPRGSTDWQDLVAQFPMKWQEEVTKVFQNYTDMTPGSYIEGKRAAVVWHFRQASCQDHAILQAAECKKDLENSIGKVVPLEFVNGKCILEARLKFVHKGRIVQALVDETRAGLGKPPDFVLCFGDDATDEDMFRALHDSGLPDDTVYSVAIGDSQKVTAADWILSDPTEVIATIMKLNKSDTYHERKDAGQDGNSKRSSKGLPIPRSYLLGSES